MHESAPSRQVATGRRRREFVYYRMRCCNRVQASATYANHRVCVRCKVEAECLPAIHMDWLEERFSTQLWIWGDELWRT